MKTVFFGTPEIAVPSLLALAETTEVVGVVCQPDRPAGRNLRLTSCPVKLAAQRLGVPVHQPVRVKDGGLEQWLRNCGADLGVVLAYGRILPAAVLATPHFGCVNLHASLLPKYRGAAPIARVLQHGEPETGVSLMKMDAGMDTGPVYLRRKLAIEPDWDAGELGKRLGELCADIVREDLRVVWGGVEPVAQDNDRSTHAPPIRAEETLLDWNLPAAQLHALVRAFSPSPGAHTFAGAKRVRILRSRVVLPLADLGAPPGTVAHCKKASLLVATGDGLLAIERAQLEGKKALDARDLINGRCFAVGDPLGAEVL